MGKFGAFGLSSGEGYMYVWKVVLGPYYWKHRIYTQSTDGSDNPKEGRCGIVSDTETLIFVTYEISVIMVVKQFGAGGSGSGSGSGS